MEQMMLEGNGQGYGSQMAVSAGLNERMSLEDKLRWSQAMASGTIAPPQFRGNAANMLFALEYAESVGVSPIQALTSVTVVNGRPTPATELMVTLARRAGHRLWHETSGTLEGGDLSVTAYLQRRDDIHGEHIFSETWDIAMARRAGLWVEETAEAKQKMGPWYKYPAVMLRNRAQSHVIRSGAVEALGGVTESAEEARDREREERLFVESERQDKPKGRLDRAKPASLGALNPDQEVAKAVESKPLPEPEPEPQQAEVSPNGNHEAGFDYDAIFAQLSDDERTILEGMLAETTTEALREAWRGAGVLPNGALMRQAIDQRVKEIGGGANV